MRTFLKHFRVMFIVVAVMFVFVGCGSVKTNSNVATNNNAAANENTNVAAVNSAEEIDTSDWETYTNEEYGFSIKHPSGWTIKEEVPFNEGKLSVRFFSPEAIYIQNQPNYTDQPLGFEVRIIESNFSP